MYFSRIALKETASRSPDFWGVFRDPYTLHQSIWKLFADHADRRRDFLYRLEEESRRFQVYTVSARTPATDSDLWSGDTKPYEPKIRTGMRLAFMLRANAVRTKNGKRHDVVMESKHRLRVQDSPRENWPLCGQLVQQEGETWLRERSGSSGFQVESVRVDGYRRYRFSKGGALVGFSTMDFSGILNVTDPERFLRLLYAGIGPAKAFGCGLMLVRRI